MAVSTRTRFEIFKRDNFTCHCCGASPLDGPLHVDHVVARKNGGQDDASNLLTACAKCNQGKSAVPLDRKRFKSGFAGEDGKEHAEQIREYLKVQRDILDAKKEVEALVLDRWKELIEEWHYSLPQYVVGAIASIGLTATVEAVEIVARRDIGHPIEQIKYFCGVVRRQRDEVAPAPVAVAAPPVAAPVDTEAIVWDATVDTFGSYWVHRTMEPVPANFRSLVIAALGVDGDADRPVMDEAGLFDLIDRAHCTGPEGFEDAITAAVDCGRLAVNNDYVDVYIASVRAAEDRLRTAEDIVLFWLYVITGNQRRAAMGNQWWAATMTAVHGALEAGVHASLLMRIVASLSQRPMEDQVARARLCIAAEAVKLKGVPATAGIAEWPEYRDELAASIVLSTSAS